ncbi:MAG: nicotinamide-nucleotide amidohydrolase family protein [Methylocystis sp.]|nr:nicotinamide-nucleotide amidohydrolase family protein [Methylocystis sp.]
MTGNPEPIQERWFCSGFPIARVARVGNDIRAVQPDFVLQSRSRRRNECRRKSTAKREMLSVPGELIAAYGAVSAEVARAMALGAIENSVADVAVAVTGVAGPGGGSAEKPVGLVHFACARRGGEVDHIERRYGPLSRAEIRAASVAQALDMMIDAVAGRSA